eukprot:scaffold205570_cov27-Tisochrysis_lutea.AAC.3
MGRWHALPVCRSKCSRGSPPRWRRSPPSRRRHRRSAGCGHAVHQPAEQCLPKEVSSGRWSEPGKADDSTRSTPRDLSSTASIAFFSSTSRLLRCAPTTCSSSTAATCTSRRFDVVPRARSSSAERDVIRGLSSTRLVPCTPSRAPAPGGRSAFALAVSESLGRLLARATDVLELPILLGSACATGVRSAGQPCEATLPASTVMVVLGDSVRATAGGGGVATVLAVAAKVGSSIPAQKRMRSSPTSPRSNSSPEHSGRIPLPPNLVPSRS